MVTDDEENRIRKEVQRDSDIEHRLTNLESGYKEVRSEQKAIRMGIWAAAAMVLASVWDEISKMVFK